MQERSAVHTLQFDQQKIIVGTEEGVVSIRTIDSESSLTAHPNEKIVQLQFDVNKMVTGANETLKIWSTNPFKPLGSIKIGGSKGLTCFQFDKVSFSCVGLKHRNYWFLGIKTLLFVFIIS